MLVCIEDESETFKNNLNINEYCQKGINKCC